jgi:predicted dehydrogenase
VKESSDKQETIRRELHPDSGVLVRVALIGVGAVAAFHHIPGIRIDPRVALVAICDENSTLLEQRAKEWGPIKATTNYQEIVTDPLVDAVVIATPNHLHLPITLECIKAKKHIMLEKPIGLNEKEAILIATEAENAGIVHMTAFTYRFAPSMRYIRKLLSDGKLGEIRHFRSQRFLDWPETSWGWRQYKKTAGAGNIYDMMIHRIDFAQYLLGNIKSVSGKVKQFVPRYKTPNGEICPLSEVDDWSALIVEFENGATGVFEGSTLMKGHHNNGFGFEWAEVNGSLGSVVYQLHDPYNILFGTHGKSLEKLPVPKEFLVIEGSPRAPDQGKPSEVFRYDQMYEFISAITEKRPSRPSFIDGAKAQVVADAALLSSMERREVDVQHPTFTLNSRL